MIYLCACVRYSKRRIVIHIPYKVQKQHKLKYKVPKPPPPSIHTVVREVHHHHKPSIIKEEKIIKQEYLKVPQAPSSIQHIISPYEKLKEEIEHEHVHHHYKHEHPSFEEMGGLGSGSNVNHVNSVYSTGETSSTSTMTATAVNSDSNKKKPVTR